MRLKIALPIVGLIAAMLLLWQVVPWTALSHWAVTAQREFQDAMAGALMGLRTGDPLALVSLCTATAAYGVVHAIGPGHGKVLLGGAALASGATFRRLAVLTVLSSLAQAGTAILLIAILVFGWSLGADDATTMAETWLAPLSAAAIAAIGAVLIWRGLRSMRAARSHHHHHHNDAACGCGHAHGPSMDDVRSLQSPRDAAVLVASIAMRPCTGALFVLVIAARFDAFAAGCLAVLAMGLGTAATNLFVAGGGVLTRRLALIGQGDGTVQAQRLSALLHVVGGGLVLGLSLLILGPYFPR